MTQTAREHSSCVAIATGPKARQGRRGHTSVPDWAKTALGKYTALLTVTGLKAYWYVCTMLGWLRLEDRTASKMPLLPGNGWEGGRAIEWRLRLEDRTASGMPLLPGSAPEGERVGGWVQVM